MTKRVIKSTSVTADIRSGLTDAQLMTKYGLSPKNLDGVFRKLLKGGSITRAELAARNSDIDNLIEVSDTDTTRPGNSCEADPRQDKYMFSGRVECVDLLDYIQFLLTDGRRAVIDVKSLDGAECMLYIDSGKLVHAYGDGLEGQEAFYQCTRFIGGEFSHLPWTDPERYSIEERSTFLLIEAARRRDESDSGDSE